MAALDVLVNLLDKKDLKKLKKSFQQMDKDQTGFITPEELKEALNLEHFDFNEEQIDSILKQVDIEPNGKINYEEFIEATVVLEKFMIEERMWIVFRHLDVDDANTIKRENIKEAMK